jgi:general secretion pathway protein N
MSGLQFASGQARFSVSELSSVVSPIAPLGRYQVQIALKSSALVSIQTEEGPLRISGEGEWVGQSLRFRGLASADDPHHEALQPVLSVLGQRQGAQAQLNF